MKIFTYREMRVFFDRLWVRGIDGQNTGLSRLRRDRWEHCINVFFRADGIFVLATHHQLSAANCEINN